MEVEKLITEGNEFKTEIEDLLTRIDILTEERDVAEDKIDEAKFEVKSHLEASPRAFFFNYIFIKE